MTGAGLVFCAALAPGRKPGATSKQNAYPSPAHWCCCRAYELTQTVELLRREVLARVEIEVLKERVASTPARQFVILTVVQ